MYVKLYLTYQVRESSHSIMNCHRYYMSQVRKGGRNNPSDVSITSRNVPRREFLMNLQPTADAGQNSIDSVWNVDKQTSSYLDHNRPTTMVLVL